MVITEGHFYRNYARKFFFKFFLEKRRARSRTYSKSDLTVFHRQRTGTRSSCICVFRQLPEFLIIYFGFVCNIVGSFVFVFNRYGYCLSCFALRIFSGQSKRIYSRSKEFNGFCLFVVRKSDLSFIVEHDKIAFSSR